MIPRLPKCADCEVRYDPAIEGYYDDIMDYGLCGQCETDQARYFGQEPDDLTNKEESNA